MGQSRIIACMYRILKVWFSGKQHLHAENGRFRLLLKCTARRDADRQRHALINTFLAE